MRNREIPSSEIEDSMSSPKPEFQDTKEQLKNPEFQHFAEILRKPDLPYYIQSYFHEGDEVFGKKIKEDGFQTFTSGEQKINEMISPHFPSRGHLKEIDVLNRQFNGFYSEAESQARKRRSSEDIHGTKELYSLLIEDVDGKGVAALGFHFRSPRKDKHGRLAESNTTIFLPNKEAAEIHEILKRNNPDEALEVLQERLDPNLSEAVPHAFSELTYAQIKANLVTDWNQANRNVNSETIRANPKEMDESTGKREDSKSDVRMASLKRLRQISANFGFREIDSPDYIDKGNKNSDIYLNIDTLTRGVLHIRMGVDGKITVDLGVYPDVDRSHDFIDQLIDMKNALRQEASDLEINFRVEGKDFTLPDKKPEDRPDSRRPSGGGPGSVPLDKQNVNYDAHRGIWYGHPKK